MTAGSPRSGSKPTPMTSYASWAQSPRRRGSFRNTGPGDGFRPCCPAAISSVSVFERFTDRARQVVVLAQDEARGLRHNYIGTEHLLLGLMGVEDGLAVRVLESFGIVLEEARACVARIVGQGDEPVTEQIP